MAFQLTLPPRLLINDDIDAIIQRGEERTVELNSKYEGLNLEDLSNFKSEASVQQWEGEDFRTGVRSSSLFSFFASMFVFSNANLSTSISFPCPNESANRTTRLTVTSRMPCGRVQLNPRKGPNCPVRPNRFRCKSTSKIMTVRISVPC